MSSNPFEIIVQPLEYQARQLSSTEHIVCRGRNDLNDNAIDVPANNWEE